MEVSANSSQLIPIPIKSLIPGMQVPVEVFLPLSEERYVLIFKAGITLDGDRLKGLSGRGIAELFVRKDDYSKFFARQVMIAGIAVRHPNFSPDKKVAFIQTAGELLMRKLEAMGFDQASLMAARETARSMLVLASSEPSLLELLERLNRLSSDTFNHSMAVGLVSVMVGRALGWSRSETLEKLALGGMLHDIGLQELSPSLIAKHRREMSYDEVKEYESHPFRGMQILQSLDIVPADVVAIAYEHHENSIGQGYPRRLWDMKIHPLARISAMADVFCELTMPLEGHAKAKTPQEALWHMEAIMGQPFNKDAFKCLKSLTRVSQGKSA